MKLSKLQLVSVVLVCVLSTTLITTYFAPILGFDIGDTSTFYMDRGPRYPYSYVVGPWNSTYYYAINGSTGARDYLSSSAATVIQGCIDTLNAYEVGGTIFLRQGIYTISTTITVKKYVTLMGEGPYATVLQATSDSVDPVVSLTKTYASLEKLKVDGYKKEVRGVQFAQGNNETFVWMRDVRVTRCNKSAVYIGPDGWWSLVDHCWIQTNYGNGVTINMTISPASGYWPTISHCLIKMNSGHGVYLEQTDKWGPAVIEHSLIEYSGYEYDNPYHDKWGVYVEKHPIHIIGCALENNNGGDEQAIYLGATSSSDTSNSKIEYCGAVGNIIIDYADYTVLRDVTLRGSSSLNITANADYTHVENVVRRLGTSSVNNESATTTYHGWNLP